MHPNVPSTLIIVPLRLSQRHAGPWLHGGGPWLHARGIALTIAIHWQHACAVAAQPAHAWKVAAGKLNPQPRHYGLASAGRVIGCRIVACDIAPIRGHAVRLVVSLCAIGFARPQVGYACWCSTADKRYGDIILVHGGFAQERVTHQTSWKRVDPL